MSAETWWMEIRAAQAVREGLLSNNADADTTVAAIMRKLVEAGVLRADHEGVRPA